MGIVTSRSFKLAAVCVALTSAAFALLFSASIFAHNKSVVQWNPESVNETLTFGETKTIPVTLTTDKNLPKTVVRVSSEIAPYVSITPVSIGKIHKGATATLTFTVRIPANAPLTTTSGVVELYKAKQQNAPDERDYDDDDSDSDHEGNGKVEKKIGRSLPITIQISVEKLPPDPGDAGKATLEGIDSDHDGVRDDVQRYIVLSIPESARHREALKDVARYTQRKLLAQSKEEAIQVAHESRAIECLSYLGAGKQGRWREVQSLMLNTEARLRAIDVYNDRITGQVFTLLPDNLKRTACTFNVETLPN